MLNGAVDFDLRLRTRMPGQSRNEAIDEWRSCEGPRLWGSDALYDRKSEHAHIFVVAIQSGYG